LPESVQDWLPQDHLARFVVEIVEQLDLSEIIRVYRGRGSDAYHPAMMLALLFYGYATGRSRVGVWSAPRTIRWRSFHHGQQAP